MMRLCRALKQWISDVVLARLLGQWIEAGACDEGYEP